MNTKIYTTSKYEAKKFAELCGVKNVVEFDEQIIGYGFDQKRKDNDCVIGFQKGSGFDEGDFKVVTLNK